MVATHDSPPISLSTTRVTPWATTTRPGWVLVVENEPAERMTLFRLVERSGHHATATDCSPRAIDLLCSEPFDLLLIGVPHGSSQSDVLEVISQHAALQETPMIAIADGNDPNGTARAIHLGAEDYVTKPVDPALLRLRIESSLVRKWLREREEDYLDVVGHVVEAAAAAMSAGSEPADLDPAARRADLLGQLARTVRDLAGLVTDLRGQLLSVKRSD